MFKRENKRPNLFELSLHSIMKKNEFLKTPRMIFEQLDVAFPYELEDDTHVNFCSLQIAFPKRIDCSASNHQWQMSRGFFIVDLNRHFDMCYEVLVPSRTLFGPMKCYFIVEIEKIQEPAIISFKMTCNFYSPIPISKGHTKHTIEILLKLAEETYSECTSSPYYASDVLSTTKILMSTVLLFSQMEKFSHTFFHSKFIRDFCTIAYTWTFYRKTKNLWRDTCKIWKKYVDMRDKQLQLTQCKCRKNSRTGMCNCGFTHCHVHDVIIYEWNKLFIAPLSQPLFL